MKASDRRSHILTLLEQASSPIKATDFADQFSVSRQVIVGDIALLRAQNIEIIATNQGYILATQASSKSQGRYRGKIACYHDAQQAGTELSIITELNGIVEDVEVEHPVYGILKASLQIQSKQDVHQFLQQMAEYEGEMLSSLTNGIHTHTITTPSLKEFNAIKDALAKENILLLED
ncbi:transcription repressor NadR [Aerococcaceae bacterium WGS1372]